jgi:hypothetical protein
MHRTYRQVTAKRNISDNAFDKGVIDFDFSIGGKTTFLPSRSYFRVGVELTKPDGSPVAQTDDVAFANFCPGNLFDNVYFLAGGQTVSSIVNYAPQAHACSYRLSKSGAWLNSIGKDAYGISSDFEYRRMQASVPVEDDDVLIPVAQDITQQNKKYFMYKPPVGIMEHSKPMGSGDYRFQFNPNSNYKTACVQSLTGKTPDDYSFNVTSMELYICTELMDVSPTGTEVLHLMEHQVQSKPLSGAGDTNFDFTVPPSTKAISIFVQSGAAGSNTMCPPSLLGCKTVGVGNGGYDAQNSIKSIQLTYANMTKPPTRWSSEFTATTKKLQQRYLDTQIESSQAFSSGGAETLQQWLDGGVLLHYSWIRDANDRSTQLQIQADFQDHEPNSNLFVVAHYTRSCEIDVSNGYISSVRSLTI